ncbi:MAG: glycerophosphoryl diester phosphodiesterase membrane domain-containing protein [Actinobacteria bacterium]|nr:glycerophosphoryl diester phosphodiesterase membrane domain-containing protein [Actinomycetota bacterium]
MSDDPQTPPPGWSDDQPPPYRAGGSSDADGWGSPADSGRAAGGSGSAWSPPPPAPKPGVIPLRPLGVGEIMAGAIDYVRREPRTVIAVAAMVGVVAAFVQLILVATTSSELAAIPTEDPSQLDADQLVGAVVTVVTVAVVTSAVAGVLQIFGTGMLTHVMGRAVVGRSTSIAQAWELVRPQLLRLIGATILVGLAVALVVIVPLAPGVAVLSGGMLELGGVLLFFGAIAAVVLGLWVTFGLILTTPVVALEDSNPIVAMKRSWRLVKGAFWRTLGIVLLGSIVAQAVGSIAASPFTLLGGAGGEITTWSVFGLAIAGMITTLVALPFVAGVTALVYIDRRIRTENLAPVLQAAAERGD